MECSPHQPPERTASLRFQSLASGSSGNAYILESAGARILFDCGIGIRQIQAGLQGWGLDLGHLTGIVLSHEHSDHVRSLDAVLRRRLPIFATRGTAAALGLSTTTVQTLSYGEICDIGDISIVPVRISHDAAEPCGLLIRAPGCTIGLFTDMGIVTDEIQLVAATCDLLIFESNHDREMLRIGPYPQHLKRRVAGSLGHLSNDQAGAVLREIATGTAGPSDVWLAHLSGTNNTPRVAFDSVAARFAGAPATPRLAVLPRGSAGPVWDGTAIRPRQINLIPDT